MLLISANSSAVASSPSLSQLAMSPAATTTGLPVLCTKETSLERVAPEPQPTARTAKARATMAPDATFLTCFAATGFSVVPVSRSHYDYTPRKRVSRLHGICYRRLVSLAVVSALGGAGRYLGEPLWRPWPEERNLRQRASPSASASLPLAGRR